MSALRSPGTSFIAEMGGFHGPAPGYVKYRIFRTDAWCDVARGVAITHLLIAPKFPLRYVGFLVCPPCQLIISGTDFLIGIRDALCVASS